MNQSGGDRFSRQMRLPGFGEAGQEKLSAARVLIVGVGALGSVQAELLARAGIGFLRLVDRDVVDLSNLQRQFLFREKDVERPKAAAAAERLLEIHSGIRVEPCVTDLSARNIGELVQGVDLILDGTDNFETRYLINDVSVKSGIPWIHGGVLGFEGSVMVVRPESGPCLRCVFPDPPQGTSLPTCETAGVLNAAVNWVASLQAAKSMFLLTGGRIPDHLFALDIANGSVRSIHVCRHDNCPACGRKEFPFLEGRRGSVLTVLCGRNAVSVSPETPFVPDFSVLEQQLAHLGQVRVTGNLLEFKTPSHRMILFPDGRVMVFGTNDPATARTWIARTFGW